MSEEDMQLYAEVPSALRVHPSSFQPAENLASCIAVLTARGIFVLKRDHGLTVADILLTMNHSMNIRCTFLTGILCDKHPDDAICPNVVLGRDYLSQADNLQMFHYIRVAVSENEVSFHAAHQALRQLSELIQTTALDKVMTALGWFFVIDADAFVSNDIRCIRLLKKPAALSVTHDDVVYCIALQLFLIRIRAWEKIGPNPTVLCKIKLWNSQVWEGLIDPNITMDHFNAAWETIAGWFKISKPWRYIINGRSVNTEWAVRGFVSSDEHGASHIKIFMILGLQGGGPSQLRSASELHGCGSSGVMDHMADFEAQKHHAALTHIFKQFVEDEHAIRHIDITEFLELDAQFMEGLFCFKGRYDLIKKFTDVMIRSGIERALAHCGWMVACHYTSIVEPVEAQIIFFRKPLMPAVSEDFLQAFLRSALIFLGMPVSQQEEENVVHTKFKLWNVVIFHGLLTRNMPLQDIIDIWDQASTIVNQDAVVRLASHTGANVNPDFAIRHFTTCGPDEKTTASFVFVRATHGGGPSEPKVANKHDFHVQQRNALASFMIQQGADIQDCIRCIESLIRGAGAEAISTIMNLKHPGKKWESLVQLSEALGIKTPEIANKVDRARKKIVGKFQEQAKSLLRNLPIESLTLQPGFLCKCDESDCIQLPRVTPNSCGVVLSSYDDAKEWLSNGSVISQDEFSLIVVGKCDHTEKAECQKVQLPVLLNQEPLVISGCLHHLGAKRASVCIDAQYDFPVTDTQVIAVTGPTKMSSAKTCGMPLSEAR